MLAEYVFSPRVPLSLSFGFDRVGVDLKKEEVVAVAIFDAAD